MYTLMGVGKSSVGRRKKGKNKNITSDIGVSVTSTRGKLEVQ